MKHSERAIWCDSSLPPKDAHLLIVDDAIDTGNTMQAALNFLIAQDYRRNRMKIAVITTTLEDAIIKADISLFKGAICIFPWSVDSPERDRFEMEYVKAGQALVIPR